MKEKLVGSLVGVLLVLLLAGVASAATVTVDVSADNVTYGDTFQVTVTYTGDGYLKILDSSGETVWSTALGGSGYDEYTIGTTNLLYPGTYTIQAYVEDSSGANATATATINVTSPTPIISIKMENDGGKVAAGDLARFKVAVYGASSAGYTITGPYGSVSGTLTVGTENDIQFDTSSILTPDGEVATGTFEIVVTADGYEKRLSFTVEPIKLFIYMPSEIRAGSTVTFAGSTNIANTNSQFDASTPNKVKLSIRAGSEDGEEIWNGTAYVVTGRFEFSIRMPLDLAEGTYCAVFTAETAPNATESVTQMFEILKPKIDIVADRTLIRGEEVEISVETSLPAGTGVALEAPSGLFEGVSGAIILSTDAAGVAKTTLRVSENAALGTYEVIAYIVARPDVSDSALFRVVLQSLDVSVDSNEVVRGGTIHLSGTTTVNSVYVYADRSNVFDGVARLPTLNSAFSVDTYPTKAATVTNDTFNITLKVDELADADEYTLYVFAPSGNIIDPVTDPIKVLTIIVKDPEITDVSYKEKLPRGQDIVIKGKTDSPVPDETLVKYRLKGPNIRYSGYTGVESDGTFEVRIDPFLGEEPKPDNMITTGLYTVELTLIYFNEDVDQSEKTVSFEIVEPQIDVEIPETVKVGEKLKITITTNRDEDYQSPLYVVMEGANKFTVYQVTVKANEAVEIDTSKLWPGNYTIYVRDIMRTTVGSPFEYYNVPPDTPYAREFYAQDDVYVTKTVRVLPADAKAEITVKAIDVSPEIVSPGTEAEIFITVGNDGLLAGNASIEVAVDGEVIDTLDVELGAGEEQVLTVKHTFDEVGTYTITAGDVEKVIEVRELPKPRIVVKDITAPSKAEVGTITVSVTVANEGDAEGTEVVELYINDQLVDTKEVTLGPYAMKLVDFEITVDEPGTYTLKSGDATATLVVTAPVKPTPTPTPIETATPAKKKPKLPGFEAVFAVAGLIGTAYLLRRKD